MVPADCKPVGRLGTGGTPELPNAPPFAKSEPKPLERREGDAIVAYPSRMFPLEARVVRRGACECSVFKSGMDFFIRNDPGAADMVDPVGVRYADGARERVGARCACC